MLALLLAALTLSTPQDLRAQLDVVDALDLAEPADRERLARTFEAAHATWTNARAADAAAYEAYARGRGPLWWDCAGDSWRDPLVAAASSESQALVDRCLRRACDAADDPAALAWIREVWGREPILRGEILDALGGPLASTGGGAAVTAWIRSLLFAAPAHDRFALALAYAGRLPQDATHEELEPVLAVYAMLGPSPARVIAALPRSEAAFCFFAARLHADGPDARDVAQHLARFSTGRAAAYEAYLAALTEGKGASWARWLESELERDESSTGDALRLAMLEHALRDALGRVPRSD